ncbi:Heat shock protein 12B [Elsinoe australis]|uniref:Heat shock protein 12B n=1 Tax=Elsinoe australis TaxID=40998 RepID=A0A2P7ZKD8_9PEZI|nr:Heat shock protein 12B [Elsinoe australis]
MIYSNSEWRGATRRSNKTPSKVVYDKDLNVERWGPQVAPHEECLQHFKILLDASNKFPHGLSREAVMTPYKKTGLEPEQVAADYLRKLRQVALEEFLPKQYGHVVASNPKIDYVLTVPAIWSDAAKDATRNAAISAGMGPSITIVTEPEAAAIYTLMSKRSLNLQVGDVFVVCDAGGGTIDVITYQVTYISKNKRRIEFSEVVPGAGAVGGGEFVDLALKKLLRDRLGAKGYAKLIQDDNTWREVMKYFQESVKELFDPLSDEASVKNFSIPFNHLFADDPAAYMSGGRMAISGNELQKLFDPSIDKALQVVADQCLEAMKIGMDPRGIILVGGFGQSPYLRSRIKDRFVKTNLPENALEVIAPENGQSAIVQGAVLQAISGGGTVVRRKARYSYGVPDHPVYSKKLHGANAKTFRDEVEGCDRVVDHIFWIIKRGQGFVLGKPALMQYRRSVMPEDYQAARSETRGLTEKLYICDSDNPPSTTSDPQVRYLGTVQVEGGFRKIHKSAFNAVPADKEAQYYELPYNLRLAPELGAMRFDFEVDDEVYGEAKIDFQ